MNRREAWILFSVSDSSRWSSRKLAFAFRSGYASETAKRVFRVPESVTVFQSFLKSPWQTFSQFVRHFAKLIGEFAKMP